MHAVSSGGIACRSNQFPELRSELEEQRGSETEIREMLFESVPLGQTRDHQQVFLQLVRRGNTTQVRRRFALCSDIPTHAVSITSLELFFVDRISARRRS